jgi:SAM-dependent MidA family methyltransferase
MAAALYGPQGFYRSAGAPAHHFRTAAHTGGAWAAAVAALIELADNALGRPQGFTVVEMGAGHGELLAGLADAAPARWGLVGVDVAPRPERLAADIRWLPELPDAFDGMLLAVEWLDVVPVDVVELTDDGPRVVEVRTDGEERTGGPPAAADGAWLDRWWPLAEVGDRAEVGRSRDESWRDAVSRLRHGVALAVDYPAVPARDVAGTLTGYKEGRQVLPVPDGSMDITAHVLFESLAGDGALIPQREALHRLGLRGRRPSYEGDASRYLAGLSRAGDESELLDPGGLGGFSWLLTAKGMPLPDIVATGQASNAGGPNATSRTPSE